MVNPGLNEFKRQFTQIKKKVGHPSCFFQPALIQQATCKPIQSYRLLNQAATPKPEENELVKALRRARESTDHSAVRKDRGGGQTRRSIVSAFRAHPALLLSLQKRQEEEDNMPELHRRFSERFPKN